jgi:hypothetical protein
MAARRVFAILEPTDGRTAENTMIQGGHYGDDQGLYHRHLAEAERHEHRRAGREIILFMLPPLIGAILVHTYVPQITKAFGKEYEGYLARVGQLVPFRKP